MRTSVTTVRLGPKEAEEALEAYLFGGRYGPRRVPRGIEPRVVGLFLAAKFATGMDEDDIVKAVDLARFYETRELAGAALKALRRPLVAPADVVFHARTVILIAELDETEQREEAARHYETTVVTSPHAIPATPVLIEAAKVLGAAAAFAALERRLQNERARLAEVQNRSEADLMAHDKVVAWIRNDLPRAKRVAEAKKPVDALKPAERMEQLVRNYMGDGPIADDYWQIWSARRLRRDAFAGAVDPTAAFLAIITPLKNEAVRDDALVAARFWRAERAFRYFGGVIDEPILEQRKIAGPGGTDFLDDDD